MMNDLPVQSGFPADRVAYNLRPTSSVNEDTSCPRPTGDWSTPHEADFSFVHQADEDNTLELEFDRPGSIPESWFTKSDLEMSNTGLQGLDFLWDSNSIPSIRNSYATSPSESIATPELHHHLSLPRNSGSPFSPEEKSFSGVEAGARCHCTVCSFPFFGQYNYARHRQIHRQHSPRPHLEEACCITSAIRPPDPDIGLYQPGSSMNGYRLILGFISWFNSHPTCTASNGACST